MENNDIEILVSSVAPKGLDEVTLDSKSSAASTESATLSATHPDDSCVTREEGSQAKETVEAASESRQATAESVSASLPSTSASPTPSYVPPVKRFNSVNINKKFLQKNQTSSGTGAGSSPSTSSSKQTGTIARPAPQTAPSHSRLVTAKLTATPASSSPGPGWSRPNSVTPPAPSPANASGPPKTNTPLIAPSGGHGPPQLAPGGKIIHPQTLSPLKQKVDGMLGPGKPAWRSVNPGAVNSEFRTQNDFPTAAEAAQGRLLKLADAKAALDVASDAVVAQKQAMSETADAFRGVHLDPNAHHWDEMEEDDNDFLGGVIEFGDGRQYTIQVSDGTKIDPKAREGESGKLGPAVPIRKEERFVDDFDRSWPRARPEHGSSTPSDIHVAQTDETGRHSRSSFSETSSNFSAHSPVSMRDGSQSRVLFNERLNRMEPYSGSRPAPGGPGTVHAPSHVAPLKRNGLEAPAHLSSNRLERDAPPHGGRSHVQVLQKSSRDGSHGFDESRKVHAFGDHRKDHGVLESSSTILGDGAHDYRKGRQDWGPPGASHAGPLPNNRPSGNRDPSASREPINGASSVTSSEDHGSGQFHSGRSTQHWAHPPQTGHKDLERQLPPHLSQPRPTFPEHHVTEADSSRRPEQHVSSEVPPETRIARPQTPPLPVTQQSKEEAPQAIPTASMPVPPADVEALQKAFLADSAERAKRRRQQEEEERAKAQERARKKAAELEAKLAAAEESRKTVAPISEPKFEPQLTAESPVRPSGFGVEDNKPTEADVLNVIEDAIKSVAPTDYARTDKNELETKTGKITAHGDGNRLPTISTGVHEGSRRPAYTPISDKAESWRAKAKPPMLPVQNSKNDISLDPMMATLPAVQAFDLQADDSMEVIDFNDIGRLTGHKTGLKPNLAASEALGSLKPRSVASDFFESTGERSDSDSWRRPSITTNKQFPVAAEGGLDRPSHQEPLTSESPEGMLTRHAMEIQPTSFVHNAKLAQKQPLSPSDGFFSSSMPSHLVNPPASPGISRLLKSPNASYREAPLSALDDTMSRIKGALDGMHSSVAGQVNKIDSKDAIASSRLLSPVSSVQNQSATLPGPPKREKWLPPALRPPGTELNHKRTETFEFTRPEPPRSPAPPDNRFTIRLPTSSRRIEPLTKRQMNYLRSFSGPVRWEILSFDPPVEGMTKRSLLVNDVLFRKPPGIYKSKKFKVLLPKPTRATRQPAGSDAQILPKVSVPGGNVTKDGSIGAFGRPRMTEQGSWRATASTPSAEGVEQSKSELDVTSRSPPPDLALRVHSGHSNTTSALVHDRNASKSKSSQKLPDGNDVAFYRDTRTQFDNVGSVPMVTFTVSSELEGENNPLPSTETSHSAEALQVSEHTSESVGSKVEVVPLSFPAPIQASMMRPEVLSDGASLPGASSTTGAQSSTQATESKPLDQSDPLLRSHPATPQPQSTPSINWGKSPARVDPEHIKAVWLQPSNKEALPTVNSLKSIADDLTAVPFTLQEVKSEDGGTPPPHGPVAPPTRMSASEVTRAFQTVPSGPSNSITSSSLRGNQVQSGLGSPMGAHRPLKPTTIGLPPPPSMNPNAPRPHFMGYPPSMSSHSPSPPTLVYSHVMPNGMSASPAATSPYGQPVWMPLVHQQGHQVVRAQPSSPYSPSLMPYHVPGAQNGMYPHPHSNGMPSSQGSPASYSSAPPSQMMVSPVLPQAAPVPPHMMYTASPVLVPVPPPGGAPQPRPYPGVVGMGRGSIPVQNPMDSRQHLPSIPPTNSASRFPVHNPGYPPMSSQSFVRPW